MKKIIMTAIISAFMSTAAFAADATTEPATPAAATTTTTTTETTAPAARHKVKKHHEVKCHVTKDGKKETITTATVADCHKAGGKVEEHQNKKPAAQPAAK